MTTSVIYADPAGYVGTDGHDIGSFNATYSTARAGDNLTLSPTNPGGNTLGQTLGYYISQNFEQFDTSSVGAGSTVSAVVYEAYCYSDFSTTDFTIEGRIHDFGSLPVTTDDWVAGADLSGKTLLATAPTSSASDGELTWTSESAFLSNIDDTGYTRLILVSKEMTDDSEPIGAEYMALAVDTPPRLIIEYTTLTLIYGRPIADLATTGWAVTPLWSKVDDDPDAPDGTTVTASV